MNASDILKYGHLTVLKSLDSLPESDWQSSGVVGIWSVKDIVAHLASFEWVLVDVLNTFLAGGPTPYLDKFGQESFNEEEVALRRDKTPAQVLDEYKASQAQTMSLAARIPAETFRQVGTLPWYGSKYSLDDFIVYRYYGHKREHCAQIDRFRDTSG